VRLSQSPIPLYYQLETIFRSQIALGEWPVGSKIPTEVEIAKKYAVSIITVKQSLANLVADGIISRKRGKGTYVERPVQGERFEPLEGSLTKAVVSEVGSTRVKVFDFHVTSPPAKVVEKLKLCDDQNVVTFKRLHYYNFPGPFSYTVNYIREDFGSKITAKDVAVSSVIMLLKDKCKVKIGCAKQVMKAIIADDQVAKHLSINIGFPILKIERVVYSIDKQTIQYVEMFYRGDRFVFRAELKID
jgi:GntR family transcriptional regulator